jgi:UTP--glucose-1-phosphate uridylyltransferase
VQTDKEYESYGILSGKTVGDGTIKMDGIIEKPGKLKAPSNFAHVSSFLFQPTVLDYVDKGLAELQDGQEFYVSDSLVEPMIQDGHAFYGYQVKDSKRYDTGDKLGYLKTVVDFGLAHPDLGTELREYLKQKM